MTNAESAWSGETRAVIDFFPAGEEQPIDVVNEMRDLLETGEANVLSLGPPVRLQVAEAGLLELMDRLPYERILVRRWPFSFAPRPDSSAPG